MKKVYTLIFAALCAATVVSCNKEIATEDTPQQEEVTPQEQTLLNPVTLTFYADPSTKIAIDSEYNASWEAGDKIQIVSFDAEGTAKYVTDVEVDIVEGKGTFTATVEDSETYYAVYPSAAEVTLEAVEGVDNLKVKIADKQDGTFKNACYYAAKTTKNDKKFNFKAISGILKFQAAEDYRLANVKDVEKTSERHALAQTETCTFDSDGNVSVDPVSNITSIISVSLDGRGTYYVAVCGNATNEVAFRFSKDTDRRTAKFEPGVYYNNLVTFEPAKIKNYGKLTDKIISDVYVAPTKQGTGDGKSAVNAAPASDLVEACLGKGEVKYTAVKGLFKYTGIWNCYRMDGLTVHFADGDYTDAFAVQGNDSPFSLKLVGPSNAILKGGVNLNAKNEGSLINIEGMTFTSTTATALTVTDGNCELKNCTFTKCSKALYAKKKCTLKNCKFTENSAASGNGTALIMEATAQVTAEGCTFASNKGTNGAAVCVNNSIAESDDFVIFSAEDCIFQNNSVTGSGGAILITQGAKKGQLRFNNCRFDGNQATGKNSHGAVFYCNSPSTDVDAPAALFNGCTFVNSKSFANTGTTGYGYSFYGNVGSRVALNNCTVKALNSGNSATPTYNFTSNGCDVALIGGAVLANSCIWADGVVGKRALASIAHKTSSGDINNSYATIVNSVVQHKSDTRSALFLNTGWYMRVYGSIFANINDYGAAVEDINYVLDNCCNRELANSDLPGANGNDDIQKGETGITHSYYTYTFDASTYTGFTPMSKSDVKDKVKNTPYVGAIFDKWLNEIGAYDVDIMGNTRSDDNMCPGSYHQDWVNN